MKLRACARACANVCVPVCMHACVRACSHAFVLACVRACMRACLRCVLSGTKIAPRWPKIATCEEEGKRICFRPTSRNLQSRACVLVCVRARALARLCMRACVRACVWDPFWDHFRTIFSNFGTILGQDGRRWTKIGQDMTVLGPFWATFWSSFVATF